MNLLRRRSLAVLALVSMAVLLAACGGDDTTSTTTDGGGDDSAGAGSETGDAEVAVQVVVGGGFTTPTNALGTMPAVTVLSDGTVLTPGIVPMIYPGPAITPVQAGTVDAAAVEELIETARTLGLLDGPLEFGSPGISDAPTTTVTIVVDGVTHRHEAYALSFGQDDALGGADPGVDESAAANRQALADFVAAADALAAGDRPWTPPAIVATVVGPSQPDPSAPTQPAVDWPLATAPATAGDFPCTLVEGPDAATLGEALASATEITGWVIDGVTYSIAFRPLVPGDPGCP